MSKIILGDCLEVMRGMADSSVDLVLTDPPYGITDLEWDIVPHFASLWAELLRVGKPNCAYVIFGRQPFTSDLINSNRKMYRYELIWEKDKGTDFGNSNRKPLNSHENISVFYQSLPTFNKQMLKGDPYKKKNYRNNDESDLNFKTDNSGLWDNVGERTPTSVITISRDNISAGTSLHPTQKPIRLMKYLVASYSNEGDTVLDPFAGSGSTLVAAKQLNRNYIGIELNPDYVKIANDRLKQEVLL